MSGVSRYAPDGRAKSHVRSLEVALLFRQRAANRAEDAAYRAFVSPPIDRLPDTMNVLLDAYNDRVRTVQKLRVMRKTASLCAIRRSRHRLSLVELRHNVDAYTLHDGQLLNDQLSIDDLPTDLNDIRPGYDDTEQRCSVELDEVTLDDVGANAPPSTHDRHSHTGGSPP